MRLPRKIFVPERLWSRSEILMRPCPVPKAPGVYAWYFRKIPPKVPVNDCVVCDGLTLLYVGISPSAPWANGKPPSRQTLCNRVRYHYQGNAEGSTLRLTLGCLLAKKLGIQLRRVGSGKRMTFGPGEERLSEWMSANAFVTWLACEEPWEVEKRLISTVHVPLNLDQNKANPFHSTLSSIRAAAKQEARTLPVFG